MHYPTTSVFASPLKVSGHAVLITQAHRHERNKRGKGDNEKKKKRDVLGYESMILQIMMPMMPPHVLYCKSARPQLLRTHFISVFHMPSGKDKFLVPKTTRQKKATFVTYTTTKKSLNSFLLFVLQFRMISTQKSDRLMATSNEVRHSLFILYLGHML